MLMRLFLVCFSRSSFKMTFNRMRKVSATLLVRFRLRPSPITTSRGSVGCSLVQWFLLIFSCFSKSKWYACICLIIRCNMRCLNTENKCKLLKTTFYIGFNKSFFPCILNSFNAFSLYSKPYCSQIIFILYLC